MTISTTVERYLTGNRVDFDLTAHPHTGSSHETAVAAHVPEDHIAKAVVVSDNEHYAMVVIPANSRLRLEHLDKELNREFHLASEDEAAHLFRDCEPGAFPPLGPAYGIETYVDDALGSLADVYFEAGDHEELVHVSGEDFRKLLGGVRHGIYSH
jgi:Ala-tRNA(Pro) deacylase